MNAFWAGCNVSAFSLRKLLIRWIRDGAMFFWKVSLSTSFGSASARVKQHAAAVSNLVKCVAVVWNWSGIRTSDRAVTGSGYQKQVS